MRFFVSVRRFHITWFWLRFCVQVPVDGRRVGGQVYSREMRSLIKGTGDDLRESQVILAGRTQCRLDSQPPGQIVERPDRYPAAERHLRVATPGR